MKPLTDVLGEFDGLDLGDRRLNRRARAIALRMSAAPARSFPEVLETAGELEGAYRFFQNATVSAKALMEPHRRATEQRARQCRQIRIVHDTTGMSYAGDREGLGSLGGGLSSNGYWAQVALAVSGGEERAPLGVVDLQTKVYPTVHQKRRQHEERRRQYAKALAKNRRENYPRNVPFPKAPVVWPRWEKWTTAALAIQKSGAFKGIGVVHVMDQEADNNQVFKALKKARCRFVIRGSSDRRICSRGDTTMHVHDQLANSEVVIKRRVRLGNRTRYTDQRAQRDERDALLSVRAALVELVSGPDWKLKLNVVEVIELRPPKGEDPVSWALYTTEPIDTPEQIAQVVDHYRARWRIEEYFKALKTGCSIEKRQLTTYAGLVRALALSAPIAWHLLAIRTAAQQDEPVPATSVLSPIQITIVRALVQERNLVLCDEPTARDALLAIAALGGHLKRNGDPGWLTLARGYYRLKQAEVVWRLANSHAGRSDQS
jgi:hypothetical protein